MLIRIAICDDDPFPVAQLKTIIQGIPISQVEMQISCYSSAEEFYGKISQGTMFDIIFLDIQMDTITGIEIATLLREKYLNTKTQIIYVTSYDTFFPAMIDTVPCGYIRKPIQAEVVEEKLRKAISRLPHLNSGSDYFLYRTLSSKRRIKYRDILYFESVKREIYLYTIQASDHFYSTMDELMERLDLHHFLRCHKSFVVNLQNMQACNRKEIVLINGTHIPIGSARLKEVHSKIAEYLERYT